MDEKIIQHTKLYNMVMMALENQSDVKQFDITNYEIDDFQKILEKELLLNMRLILENIRKNNLTSMGIDVSTRVIIEIIALLEANKIGQFNETQKRLFLINYLATDIEKNNHKNVVEEIKQILSNSYDRVIDEYVEILQCSKDEAIEISKDLHNFLKYGADRKYNNFASFVRSIFGFELTSYREIINIHIHPTYSDIPINVTCNNIIVDRMKIINTVLSLATKYIPQFETSTYVKSKWKIEYIDKTTLSFINSFKSKMKDAFKFYPHDPRWNDSILEDSKTRYVIFSSFRKLVNTLCDILICESLKFRAQTISRVKSFIELTSLLLAFEKSNNIDYSTSYFAAFSYLNHARNYGKASDVIRKIKNNKKLNEDEQSFYNMLSNFIEDLYNDFYKKYNYPENKDVFFENVTNYPLYYLDGSELTFSALSFKIIDENIVDRNLNYWLKNDYKKSARLGHASAYKSIIMENKTYNIIPNLLTYFKIAFEKYYVLDDSYIYLEFLSELIDEIKINSKEAFKEQFNKTYKKL